MPHLRSLQYPEALGWCRVRPSEYRLRCAVGNTRCCHKCNFQGRGFVDCRGCRSELCTRCFRTPVRWGTGLYRCNRIARAELRTNRTLAPHHTTLRASVLPRANTTIVSFHSSRFNYTRVSWSVARHWVHSAPDARISRTLTVSAQRRGEWHG